MFSRFLTFLSLFLITVSSSVFAFGSSRTYNGGKTWYHSDGSSTRTYDGGRSWYNSDGSSSRTYDGGQSWYYNR